MCNDVCVSHASLSLGHCALSHCPEQRTYGHGKNMLFKTHAYLTTPQCLVTKATHSDRICLHRER